MDNDQTKPLEEKKPRKKRGRPSTVKFQPPQEVLNEPSYPQFILTKLPRVQKKQLEVDSTPEVLETAHLPRSMRIMDTASISVTDAKKDHLFIKGIRLEKNLFKGRWEIIEVNTNKGKFSIGEEQNNRLSQQVMQKMTLYLRSLFESDLEEFLVKEQE